MKYHAETTLEPDFLRITATGEYDYDDMFGFIAFVRAECERTGNDRVLIDCSELKGMMTEVERFEGGQKIAEIFGPSIKAALVLPAFNVTRLGEMAAVNRGARFMVGSSVPVALVWLLES